MKLFLTNREQLQSIGSFLVSELDSLVSRIRASWSTEHNEDDTHGHVHSDSLSTGRLSFGDIAMQTISATQVDNFEPAGIATAAMLRLDATVPLVSITGLKVPQDEGGNVIDGRVLVIENASATTVFILEAEHTASSPRNRFYTPYGPPSGNADPMRLYLRPASLTTVVYNSTKARHIVLSQSNDNTVQHSTFSAARQDNVSTAAIGRARICRVDTAGVGASISGFDSTNIPVTTRLTVMNVGLYKFPILHQNTNSLAANRVVCPSGIQYIINPRESVDLYKTEDGWRVIEKADQWIDVAYSAGNFLASAGTWTVEAGDLVTLAYQIDGDMMTVAFQIENSSLSAGPATLTIPIPASRIAARKMSQPLASVVDNGTALDTGRAEVAAGGTVITFYKNAAGGVWTASANLTNVCGQITFKVRDDSATISESHTDVAHGDAAHADVDHSDVAHVDVVHGDAHSDASHTDVTHGDVVHVDSSSHSDVVHDDVAHADSTSHSDVAHEDIPHDDTHNDGTSHNDHDDGIHGDRDTHADAHTDVSHDDVAHVDSSSHSDVAHEDIAHVDSTSHSDTAHSDVAHVDGGHSDSHTDTVPHSDSAHADVAHGDAAHADSSHSDVGYHTDNAHADL